VKWFSSSAGEAMRIIEELIVVILRRAFCAEGPPSLSQGDEVLRYDSMDDPQDDDYYFLRLFRTRAA
jgi:hypothetical protein